VFSIYPSHTWVKYDVKYAHARKAIVQSNCSSSKNTQFLILCQVGKSTLLKSLNPQRIIDLSEEGLFLIYAKDVGRLKRERWLPINRNAWLTSRRKGTIMVS